MFKNEMHVQCISTVEFLALNKSSEMGVMQVKGLFQTNKHKYIVLSGGTVASCLVRLSPD